MPITWRNIEAPDFTGVSSIMGRAQTGMDRTFDAFNTTLQKQQEANSLGIAKQQEALKQGFLDAVYGAKTLEDLDAVQGRMGELTAGMTPETRATIRGQDEQRRMNLRTMIQQERQFDQQKKEWEAAPIVDRLTALGNSPDAELRQRAQEALGIYSSNGMLPNAGALSARLTQANQSQEEFGMKKNEDSRSQIRLDDQLKNSVSQRATAATQRESARLQQEASRMQLDQARDAHTVETILANAFNLARGREFTNGLPTPQLLEGLADKLTAEGVSAKIRAAALEGARKRDIEVRTAFDTRAKAEGRIGPEAVEGGVGATKALLEALGNIKDPDDAELIRNNLTELIQEGLELPNGQKIYPSGNLIRQVVPAAQGLLGWNWGIGVNAKKQAIQLMKDPAYIQEYAERLDLDTRAKFLSGLPAPEQSSKPVPSLMKKQHFFPK